MFPRVNENNAEFNRAENRRLFHPVAMTIATVIPYMHLQPASSEVYHTVPHTHTHSHFCSLKHTHGDKHAQRGVFF